MDETFYCRRFWTFLELVFVTTACYDHIQLNNSTKTLLILISEGELRVFLFAEQVTSLCLLLVQIRTILAVRLNNNLRFHIICQII